LNEDEWLTSADPSAMLDHLKGKVSDRKLRLFACACCRRMSPLVAHEDLRRGIETAEQYADRRATYQEMVWAAKAAERAGCSLPRNERGWVNAVWTTTAMGLWYWLRPFGRTVRTVRHLLSCDVEQAIHQARLLRDIFGNPFRPPPALDPTWLTDRVVHVARGIYDERDFTRLPELAGALEEAGCTDAGILEHCREGGEHVRGCWVMDFLLASDCPA
jgi:hypothetical protein